MRRTIRGFLLALALLAPLTFAACSTPTDEGGYSNNNNKPCDPAVETCP